MKIQLPQFLEQFTNLHIPRNVDKFRFDHRGRAFIYGLYCAAEDMIYIGSTWDSARRFRQHLITGHSSNLALQTAIQQHGLKDFTLYVFEYVDISKLDAKSRKEAITTVEQKYIDLVPTEKQYNSISSKTKSPLSSRISLVAKRLSCK